MECKDCGDEIPKERVRANPKTRICIECQEQREKSGKFNRHTMEINPEIESWNCVGVTQSLVRGKNG